MAPNGAGDGHSLYKRGFPVQSEPPHHLPKQFEPPQQPPKQSEPPQQPLKQKPQEEQQPQDFYEAKALQEHQKLQREQANEPQQELSKKQEFDEEKTKLPEYQMPQKPSQQEKPLQKKEQTLNKKQLSKQQAAARELSWEVTSELGSELGDDKPSVNWPKKKKPEKESLASYLAKFEMPEVPLLQILFEDVASELKTYREYWKKKNTLQKPQGFSKEADFAAGGAAQPHPQKAAWNPANNPETGFAGQE